MHRLVHTGRSMDPTKTHVVATVATSPVVMECHQILVVMVADPVAVTIMDEEALADPVVLVVLEDMVGMEVRAVLDMAEAVHLAVEVHPVAEVVVETLAEIHTALITGRFQNHSQPSCHSHPSVT